jgi:hypothetical protein
MYLTRKGLVAEALELDNFIACEESKDKPLEELIKTYIASLDTSLPGAKQTIVTANLVKLQTEYMREMPKVG